MTVKTSRFLPVFLAGLALSGCASGPGPMSATENMVDDDVVAEELVVIPAAPETEETTALIYEWDTQYSAFLSPPIEVRRQARADCTSEGYEIAIVETLKLEGNVATAIFICRGDFE